MLGGSFSFYPAFRERPAFQKGGRKKEHGRLPRVLLFTMLKVKLQNRDIHLFLLSFDAGSMALIERMAGCKRRSKLNEKRFLVFILSERL